MSTIEARLEWEAGGVRHCDRLLLPEAALQADGRLLRAARELEAGPVTLDPTPWILPAGQPPILLPKGSWQLRSEPLPGRFYPRLAFAGLAEGVRDLRPCRLLAAGPTGLRVDPNHPLAGPGARLTLRRSEAVAARVRFVQLFDGPGMQRPPVEGGACYLPQGALARADESPDAVFYAQPRLVHHLDAACRAEVARLYGRLLQTGQRVLDLMASWQSHLPEGLADLVVTGLGLNAAELAANPRLAHWRVQDLNADPVLPFPDGHFDAVVCTASVEYLTRPVEVLAQLRRVLRAGGVLAITFSDRWFPPKAIRVWGELHPFERLGMVLWLLREAGFRDLHGETLRGEKRPEDDKYAAEREVSDPLFAAWGRA